MVASLVHVDWAKSLVGRDWEIFWSEEDDNDKTTSENSMDVEDDNNTDESDKEGDGDDSSEGSIIDDWYAGHVVSLEDSSGGKFTFKVRFVGEEDIYEMVLEPTKVRPSARGWIKRTKALLLVSQNGDGDYEQRLPPDTSMIGDQAPLNNLRAEIIESYSPGTFEVSEHKEGVQLPRIQDVKQVLKFRYLLRAQILLRSRLSTIVNHHGSTKYVDGEPNPTESYVEHLAQCCQDMDLVCGWYLRCWELLVKLFGGATDADEPSDDSESELTIDNVFRDYLEYGKISLVNCATMDVSPTASKRRLLSSETSSSRRPKRRRKLSRWGTSSSDGIDIVADECDLRVPSSVDLFVKTLRESTNRWFQTLFANMLQTISHFVVDPAIRWQLQCKQLIGQASSEVVNDLDAVDDGIDAAGKAGSDDDENDDSQGDSDDEPEEQFFSLEEVDTCYDLARADPVLVALDIQEEIEKLRKKISDISMAAAYSAHLLKSLSQGTDVDAKEKDAILAGLKSILDSASTPGDSLYNIEPIGGSESPVTRSLLSKVLDFRSWLLDVWRAQKVRVRFTFLQDLETRLHSLPDLAEGEGMLDRCRLGAVIKQASVEIQTKIAAMANCDSLIAKHGRELDLRSEGSRLMSRDGAMAALKELANCPALSLVEEKVAIRVDLLEWGSEAKSCLAEVNTSRLGYQELERLNKSLQSILTGRSRRRMQLVHDLEQDQTIDRQVCHFASEDSAAIFGTLVDKITTMHIKAKEWKERAGTILIALRAHGNAAAGETAHPTKLPAMVDIKRIKELLDEYDSIPVDQLEVKQTLERVSSEANAWSAHLVTTIEDEKFPLDDCLSFLSNHRDCRPKGLIMDPTRNLFDSVLDLLVWHNRVKAALDDFSSRSNSSDSNEAPLGAEDVSLFYIDTMYPLLAEGIEVVDAYTDNRNAQNIGAPIKFDVLKSLKVLESLYGVRRSARAISNDRLDSHPIGPAILSRLVNPSEDSAQGYPLLGMLWVQWHVSVAELVHEFGETSDDEYDIEKERSAICTSLSDAKNLLAQRPIHEGINIADTGLVALSKHTSSEVAKLDRLVREAEKEELGIRDLLQNSKEMLRGSIHKADSVRNHLTRLKESLVTLKDRSQGDGLSLDPALEPQLEHHIKVFTWLVRTFAYPLLHLDEASFSFSDEDVQSNQRIPYDILISLYDRMPCEVEKQAGDFALISLRVRELYSAATQWQDEITRNTTISFRGGKRRSLGPPGVSDKDQEASAKLQIEEMKKLAENPILSKVAMPRENAVNGILESSSQFEVELQQFLGKDYGGYSPDRAPFPAKKSLVGENGEFILYRLTGSPLFSSLQSSLQTLSNVGSDVLAETPGKATFDWIVAAVSWIEQLSEAITSDSPFENINGRILVIPATEARALLKDGESIFLTIPEDLKRTLSKHGIFVTTNKQDRAIRVMLKKDGAHHSVGGTVIRWCPILFECLKADVSRLDEWEKALTAILSDFNAFFSETRDHAKTDTKNLYQWFCYREQVQDLLQQGQESLVISPQKGLVSSFQNLLASINNYLNKHCKTELEEAFAKKWFAESTSLVDDRFLLLESLFHRSAAAEGQHFPEPDNSPSPLQSEKNFRDACRSYMENSFVKASKAVGLDNSCEWSEGADIKSYGALVAWDIEREMFERFQGELGTSRVSEEYRSKARSLRCSLEDKNNISLCLRVLSGDINAGELITMSSEELASQKTKTQRARAEKEAKLHANLTPRVKGDDRCNPGKGKNEISKEANEPQAGKSTGHPKAEKTAAVVLKSVLRVPKHSPAKSITETPTAAEALPSSSVDADAVSTTDPASSDAAKTDEFDESSPAALMALMKASKKSRPPPPPSLAASFQSSTASNRGIRVTSEDGGDSFRVEIGNPRSAFLAAFYLEHESMKGVNGFLSGTLGERGRLRSEEFSRFLRDKLSGGRWQAIPLRLATVSEEDAVEYKKFYKEYEMRNRIAMFYVGQNSKLFLVTPKFHDAAKSAGLGTLSNRTSTYAVLLTKEIIIS